MPTSRAMVSNARSHRSAIVRGLPRASHRLTQHTLSKHFPRLFFAGETTGCSWYATDRTVSYASVVSLDSLHAYNGARGGDVPASVELAKHRGTGAMAAERRLADTSTLLALAVLVIVCCSNSPVARAQSAPGLLNIDCGANASYTDTATGLEWVPDNDYIPTGTNHQDFLPPTDSTFAGQPELNSLRAFTDDVRVRNCYRLPVTKNTTYLLRATFFYGNYDNAAKPPSFQLSIEATVVENITTTSTGVLYKELLYLSQSNVTFLCLLRDGSNSAPFISAISLRQVNELYTHFDTYLAQFRYLTIRTRVDFGGSALVRYPDDAYDRFWHPEGAKSSYLAPSATPVEAVGVTRSVTTEAFRVPSKVMQSAISTAGNLTSYYTLPGSATTYQLAYVLVHFAELDSSATATSRQFYIDVGTNNSTTHYNPVPLNPYNYTNGSFIRATWLFWDRVITPSTLLRLSPAPSSPNGPILNAMELYSVSDERRASTIDRDVFAIEAIKASMNLSAWTGDPCLPSPYPWVECQSGDSLQTPSEVTAINLSGYNLMGPISPSFASLLSLTTLSLANNALAGPLPNLSALISLKSLHLENNNLGGALPDWLTSLPALKELYVQNNNFSGQFPPGLLSSNIQFTYCPGNKFLNGDCKENSKKSNVGVVVGAAVGGAVLALLLLGVGIFCCIWCYRRHATKSEQNTSIPTARPTPIPLKELGNGDGLAKGFTYAALAAATQNFKTEIGRGGFGPVYHGTLPDGREVAVKVADKSSRQGDPELYNEVTNLSKLHHKNLVALVGYCQEKKKQILVYEYVRNGSLFDHLHGNPKPGPPLDWKSRLSIALNAAQGLDYLHSSCSPSIIHRDVKSANILLTGPGHAEVAKVADFGLSKAGPLQDKTHVYTQVRGTAGYLDPEYFDSQKLNLKSDVFSFGVVLLELITGRIPIDPTRANRDELNICQYVRSMLSAGGDENMNEILDPAVRACRPNVESLWVVAEVALRSVEPKAVHRPAMADVLQELRAAMALERTPPTTPAYHPRAAPPRSRSDSRPPGGADSDPRSDVFYEPDSLPAPR